MNDPETIMRFQNMREGPSIMSFLKADGVFHDHGDGYHSHGYTISVLLDSFDHQKFSALLNDVRRALLLILNVPGVIEDDTSLLGHNLPLIVRKSMYYFLEFLNSVDIDIPTPPPKLIFS
jgi:hypothetical protein